MSGPSRPDPPPPEVPEEFAEAYRVAYERALAAQPEGPQPRQEPVEPSEPSEPAADGPPVELPEARGPVAVGDPPGRRRAEGRDEDEPTAYERVRDSRWFVPLLLALLAVLLILGAYAVGRAFSGRVGGAAQSGRGEDTSVGTGPGATTEKQPATRDRPRGGAWDGPVTRVGGLSAAADCTYRTGVDASGARVTYGPDHLTDGTVGTTWRCDGSAVGQRLVIGLGRAVPVGEVGLIPGYAKTDEADGADRYAENNRITRVRWTIGRTRVVQRMDGTASDRSLRLLRVPRTTATRVVLEILSVQRGPRDTTAISEVTVGRATN